MFDISKDTAKNILRDLGKLEASRRPLEVVWQSILEMIDPANAFITKKYIPIKDSFFIEIKYSLNKRA